VAAFLKPPRNTWIGSQPPPGGAAIAKVIFGAMKTQPQ
jgi:hypothetical protein